MPMRPGYDINGDFVRRRQQSAPMEQAPQLPPLSPQDYAPPARAMPRDLSAFDHMHEMDPGALMGVYNAGRGNFRSPRAAAWEGPVASTGARQPFFSNLLTK